MRGKGIIPLCAVLLAIAIPSHAAKNVSGLAVNSGGQAIALSGKTLVVKAKPAMAPVQATVTCVQTVKYTTSIYAPPAPELKFPEMRLFVSATAGSKTYYVNLFSIGAPGASAGQAVVSMGVATAYTGGLCGAGSVATKDAVGVAVYR
jgi:hypothetical protein